MNISLTRELAKFVEDKIQAGVYPNAERVINESLQLLKELDEQDRAALDDLRRTLRLRIEQAGRGELEDVDDGIAARIREEGKKILAGRRG